MSTFEQHWTSTTTYLIYEVANSRYIDEQNYVPYLEWLSFGNVPEPKSGDRFISIVNGLPVEDPEKENILAAEEYERLHPMPTIEERLEAAEAVIVELLKGGA